MIKIPCPHCNGDGFLSIGDRHVENRKEVCARCGGAGEVDPETGQRPETSSGAGTGAGLYAARFGAGATAQDPAPALGLPAGEAEGLRALSEKATQGVWAIDHTGPEEAGYASLKCTGAKRDGRDRTVSWHQMARFVVEIDGKPSETGQANADLAIALVNAYRSGELVHRAHVLAPPASAADGDGPDWREDPATDERWNDGLLFGMAQLCVWLDVEIAAVNWDAATETLEGDVQSVLGNILRQKFGDDFDFKAVVPLNAEDAPTPGETPGQDAVAALCDRLDRLNTVTDPQACADVMDEARAVLLASLRSTQADTGGDGWPAPQPMETAPRDGSWFLGAAGKQVIPFRWSQHQFNQHRNGWDFKGNGLLIPTCWWPLPPAPTPLATDGEG